MQYADPGGQGGLRRQTNCRLAARATAGLAACRAWPRHLGRRARWCPPALSQSTNTQKALAYSRCMRSHGVSRYPDPASSGAIPKVSAQQLGVSGAQLQAAQRDCQHLVPNGGQPTPAALQQSWTDFLKFAQCMRGHGVSSWPDPTRYPAHPDRPYFDLQRAGIDLNSPQISAKIHGCLPLLHGNNPQHLG